MNQFKGKVELRLCNEASRSEGLYAYLCGEEREWELTREGGMPFDDEYYKPFDGREVVIEGEERDGFIIVDHITEEQDAAE